jgi:hypothetical protein
MKSQLADLSYGEMRERANHTIIEEHLGVRIQKLGKYDIMDWKEVSTDETPPWLIEQKARNVSLAHVNEYYAYNGKPTALIGKHKIDYIKNNGGVGIIYFDFTDKLMYWVYDENEYNTFDVEDDFVRHQRSDYVDKRQAVVHIPTNMLKSVKD